MSAPYKPKHADKGMPYFRLYTAILNDQDLLDAGDEGWLVATKSMAYVAQQGTGGIIPSDARRVQRYCHLDGGVEAVQRGIDRLLECDFLVTTDDTGRLLIRSWARFQVDLGGSQTRPASSSVGAFSRRHKRGEHAPGTDLGGPSGNREGCPFCADGTPHGPQEAAEAPAAPQEPATDVLDAKTVNTDLWTKFDAQVAADTEAGVPILETYLDLADMVSKRTAAKYADVPRISETILLNLVIDHATKTLWDGRQSRELHGWRSDIGAEALLTLMVKHADKDKPVAYLRTIVKNGAAA